MNRKHSLTVLTATLFSIGVDMSITYTNVKKKSFVTKIVLKGSIIAKIVKTDSRHY